MGTPIPHGTAAGYTRRKCRCQPCREANTEAARITRARRRALNPPPTTEERFWSKVQKTDACWNWTGSKDQAGYGAVRIKGERIGAHRASYEMVVGPIPEGAHIDHLCFNTSCVRPDHLRPVTRKQNGEHRKGAPVHSKSGIRGVTWNSHMNKWRGQVVHNGKQHYAGHFADIADAEAAVIAKRNELHTHNDLDRAA